MPTRYAVVLLLFAPMLASAAEPMLAGRTLSQWVKDLDDPSALVREEAVDALASLGPAAKPAVSRLEALLRGEATPVRRKAALALWKIDGRTGPGIEEYRADLKADSPTGRAQAIEMLLQLGVAPGELVEPLADLLIQPDRGPRGTLEPLMLSFGPAAGDALTAAIPKARGAQRVVLVGMASRLGPSSAKLVPAIRPLLDEKDLRTRFTALRVLWTLHDDRPALVKRLIADAASTDTATREEALGLAVNLRPRPAELAPLLRTTMKDVRSRHRFSAIAALYDLDPKSLNDTMPVLVAALRDGIDDGGREWPEAVRVVSVLGPAAKEALPDLVKLPEQPNARNFAFFLGPAIGRMGPDALDPVIKMLAGSDQGAQMIAVQALPFFGKELVPKLIPHLKDLPPGAQREALRTLGRFGPACREAVPELVELLKKTAGMQRSQIIVLLGQIGRDARDAVPELVKLVDDSGVASVAIRALGLIGPAAKESLPALGKVLKGGQVFQSDAADAMLLIDPATKAEVIAELTKVMDGPGLIRLPFVAPLLRRAGVGGGELSKLLKNYAAKSDNHRVQVAVLLGAAQTPVHETASFLIEWLADENPIVKQESAIALARLGKGEAVPVLQQVMGRPVGTESPLAQFARVLLAVEKLGPPGRVLVPDLLRHWDNRVFLGERPRMADLILALDAARGQPALAWLRQQAGTPTAMTRLYAFQVLARHDAKNPAVLAALRQALGEQSSATAATAAECIGRLGEAGRPAMDDLRAMTKEPAALRRVAAATALWKLGAKADELVPVLRDALSQTDDPEIIATFPLRMAPKSAAETLGEIGAAARPALPALRDALSLGDPPLRSAATVAIEKIEKAK